MLRKRPKRKRPWISLKRPNTNTDKSDGRNPSAEPVSTGSDKSNDMLVGRNPAVEPVVPASTEMTSDMSVGQIVSSAEPAPSCTNEADASELQNVSVVVIAGKAAQRIYELLETSTID